MSASEGTAIGCDNREGTLLSGKGRTLLYAEEWVIRSTTVDSKAGNIMTEAYGIIPPLATDHHATIDLENGTKLGTCKNGHRRIGSQDGREQMHN